MDVVFVCGGDGTVMACATELAGSGVALAVLPCGTGNLLAGNLCLPTAVAEVVALAVGGQRRRVYVGALENGCFAVMAGMGFDAAMMESSSDVLKKHLGWPAYVLGGLRRLGDRPMRLRIRLDGQPAIRRRARSVLVANVGKLQGGIELLPEARPDDGVFDIAVLTPRHLRDWFTLAWAVLRKRPSAPRMETFRARNVTILSDKVQQREADGDLIAPSRELSVTVRPGALLLCAP